MDDNSDDRRHTSVDREIKIRLAITPGNSVMETESFPILENTMNDNFNFANAWRKGMNRITLLFIGTITLGLMALAPRYAPALEYLYQTAEPQKSGWPLTEDEKQYVLKAEHERRPGREQNKHMPELWPVVPSAGFWGGTTWLDLHAKLVKDVEVAKGPIDILLVGDSITMQWGAAWQKHFGRYKTVNIGIGGDKTQNVLWRLDHGGVAGIEPRLVILLIGNNNMFFTPETGTLPAARGIKICVDNLREKFPQSEMVVVKIFPAHAPGNPFYEDIKKTNTAMDTLKLEDDPKVHVLDLWNDLVNADGTLKKDLFMPDNIHLTQDGGYELYAGKLKPVVEGLLSGNGFHAPKTAPPSTAAPAPTSTPKPKAIPKVAAEAVAEAPGGMPYPYAPYNEGRMDPQRTGWPLTEAEMKYVMLPEYSRKPGHELMKHLPEMWPVTPSAGHWGGMGGNNRWLENHANLVDAVRTGGAIDILLLGDSITQYWGGSVIDKTPFTAAWENHFGKYNTVNIGIAGDRTENVLWRLEHGAVEGTSPKVIVLLIGTNDTPLVAANGVPAKAVAQGIRLCVESLRAKCPESQVVVVKILPAFTPGNAVYEAIKNVNAALDMLKLESDPKVHVLDLWNDFTNPDGSLKTAAYADGHLHLSPAGYEIWAGRMKPLLVQRP